MENVTPPAQEGRVWNQEWVLVDRGDGSHPEAMPNPCTVVRLSEAESALRESEERTEQAEAKTLAWRRDCHDAEAREVRLREALERMRDGMIEALSDHGTYADLKERVADLADDEQARAALYPSEEKP